LAVAVKLDGGPTGTLNWQCGYYALMRTERQGSRFRHRDGMGDDPP